MKNSTTYLKRISLWGIVIGAITLSITTSISYGQGDEWFYYGTEYEGTMLNDEQKTDLAQVIKDDSVNTEDTTLLYKIRQYFRLTGTDTYDQDKPATGYINMIINMALGLTSFISLILILYAFYLMFFEKGEEGFAKAKKILIWVAIALVVMALSWLIVSFFFEIYTTQAVKNI